MNHTPERFRQAAVEYVERAVTQAMEYDNNNRARDRYGVLPRERSYAFFAHRMHNALMREVELLTEAMYDIEDEPRIAGNIFAAEENERIAEIDRHMRREYDPVRRHALNLATRGESIQ